MTTATEGTELQSAGAQDEGGKGKEPLDLGNEVVPKQPATAATTIETDEGEDTGKTSNGIPRARMNEVIRQREAAQAEAEQLRREIEHLRAGQGGAAPAPAAQVFDIQAAEEQYAQAMLDGDVKVAAALRMQINAHIEEAAFTRFTEATSSQQAATRAQATVDELLQVFPWLDAPEGAEALELIEASVMLKMSRGTPRHQALAEATNAIAPRFAPGSTPSRVLPTHQGSVDTRTERANQRGAADSLLQPAAVQAGMGNRATPAQVDATRLSDDEYMALPEAERKRLRGD